MTMLSLVTPPDDATAIVSLAELKSRLGITGTDSDAALTSDLNTAVAFFDGPEGLLGRALRPQTWDYLLYGFPFFYRIEVPLPPLISVTSISYFDVAGSAQTLDPSAYQVLGAGGRGVIIAATPPWPSTQRRLGAVKVRFQCGYPDLNAATTVPEPIRTAIVLKVAQLRGLGRADSLLKQDSVIGVSSQLWDTSGDAGAAYDKAINSLVARYTELSV